MVFGLIGQFDYTLLQWVWSWRHEGWLQYAMVALSLLGSGYALLPLLGLWARTKTRAFAGAAIRTVVLTAIVTFLLKRAFHRLRPCACLAFVNAGPHAPTDFSLPSGHAAGSFAFAAFVIASRQLGPSRPLLTCMLYSVAFGVALSRVYLGVHFPTDVAAGAALGSVLGTLGGLHFRRAWPWAARKPADEPGSRG